MNCRVLVAESHWLVRRGLCATLQQVDGFELVGEAANLAQVLALAHDLAPELVLVDMDLAGGGGVAALRALKGQHSALKVLLLSEQGNESTARDALRAGCDGFARKDHCESELLEALGCVQRGVIYIDAELSRQLVMADYRREPDDDAQPLARLTQRERDVFRLIASGHTNRSAGEQMQLSAKTVEKYRATVMRKLGLRNALELQLKARDLDALAAAAGTSMLNS
jgi:DNA-binding NarL/FixJ family response regulator